MGIPQKHDPTDLLGKKIRKGDLTAFDQLYRQFSERLYGFAFSMLKDHEDAKEIVQDTFFRLWEKRSQLNPSTAIRPFLFSVAYHTTIDFIRKKLKDDKYRSYLHSRLSGNYTEDLPGHYRELVQTIREVIEKLPDQRKKIYLMSREEQLTHKEIAEQLNISAKTVENQINLALKAIRKQLRSDDLLGILLLLCLW